MGEYKDFKDQAIKSAEFVYVWHLIKARGDYEKINFEQVARDTIQWTFGCTISSIFWAIWMFTYGIYLNDHIGHILKEYTIAHKYSLDYQLFIPLGISIFNMIIFPGILTIVFNILLISKSKLVFLVWPVSFLSMVLVYNIL